MGRGLTGSPRPPLTQAEADLYHWRFQYAADLGYSTSDAARLAASKVDLHDVEKLLKAGCRHDLAERIAWPVQGATR